MNSAYKDRYCNGLLNGVIRSHNYVIDAGNNSRLFALGTDMDRALLRLSHMQNGTYYVQMCDKMP